MYVAGDAAATAGNVVANAGLVRLGVVADLVDGTFFVFLALTLYLLLKHVHKSVASAMVVLVALAAGITCLNAVFQFEGLQVATGAVDLAAFGTAGSNGARAAPARHPALRAPRPRRSSSACGWCRWDISPTSQGGSPRRWASLLIVAGVCYLVDLLAAFLVPDFGQQIHAFIVIPCAIAEIWMVGYLLVIGVRTSKTVQPDERVLVPA